jgi:hypothetical protein
MRADMPAVFDQCSGFLLVLAPSKLSWFEHMPMTWGLA